MNRDKEPQPGDNWKEQREALAGLKAAIINQFKPLVIPALDTLAAWINKLNDWYAGRSRRKGKR